MKAETIRMLRLRALALLTVAGTAWISFSSSQDLAVRAGFGIRSWAFPICLDAVAAFAVDIWMRRSGAQRAAGTLALFAIGLSLASNVADHYLTAGTALAALLGGIPPAMLAWLLLVLHRHGSKPVPAATDKPTGMLIPPTIVPDEVKHDLLKTWEHYERPVVMSDLGEIRYPDEPDAPTTVHTPPLTPVSTSDDQGKQVDVHTGQTVEPVNRYPLPVNVPDNDAERTQILPRITDEMPGKHDPAAPPDPAPAKVQPARREASAEVSVPVAVGDSSMSNEDLISLAIQHGLSGRRTIAAAFKVGTGRAGDIARAVKGKTDGQ